MPEQCGIYHETYASDNQLRPTTAQRVRLALIIAGVALLPFIAGPIELRFANNVMIAAIGAIGLNILVGYTGQISLGQGAFLAVGAYSSALLGVYLGVPWWLSIVAASFITAIVGGIFGIPSLRLKGLYLAVATLAAQQIIEWVIKNWDPIDGDINGRVGQALNVPDPYLLGYRLNTNETAFYVLAAVILAMVIVATVNLFRTHIGRAFIAIRDQDIAAEVMGVNVFRYKLLAFAVSSFFVGLSGALTAQHSTSISWESYTIEVSIAYLAMIIIGGLGSISGSIYGAVFITLLPQVLRGAGNIIEGALAAGGGSAFIDQFTAILPYIQQGAFGLAIILTLIVEPEGIVKLWRDIKDYFRLWPFSY